MSRIGVLGAGSWGTTLADLLARRGHAVRVWAREPEVVASINQRRENPLYLPDVQLAPGLTAVASTPEAVEGAELVVSAAPSHAVRTVCQSAAATVAQGTVVVSVTKGLETESLLPMSAVLQQVLPQARVAVLSGPSFAREVAEGQPTAVVAASADPAAAAETQSAFVTSRFRVYTASDVVGAELAGALKNVIAIAAGMLEGLGLGHNPRAALLTRGLAEMARLGAAMGADPLTFAGLAGMGDLVLTATGSLSRNRALGLALAQGESLADFQARHRTVAEGVNSARAASQLARRVDVELPITNEVCAILFEGKPPRESVGELMGREPKPEQWR